MEFDAEINVKMHTKTMASAAKMDAAFNFAPQDNLRELLVSVFLRTLKRTPTFQNVLKELRRSATHAEALKLIDYRGRTFSDPSAVNDSMMVTVTDMIFLNGQKVYTVPYPPRP